MIDGALPAEAGPAPPRWIQGADFETFWAGVWRSPKGKEWAGSGRGFSGWLKERLRGRPFFLSDPWEPELQRRHFAQMWGQIFSRRYENPALSDLFWIHELTHWAAADLTPSPSFAQWLAKWDLNELRASAASEILIHGEVEGWDREAFGRDVWARRFGKLGGTDPENAFTWSPGSRKADERRHAIRDGERAPDASVPDEVWLASFKAQNEAWAELWRGGEWRRIDRHLAVYGHAVSVGDLPRARFALESAGELMAFPKVPYKEQAVAFWRASQPAPEAAAGPVAPRVAAP